MNTSADPRTASVSKVLHPLSGVLVLLFVLLSSSLLHAQGDMRFFGTATKDNHAFPGALISVTLDGREYKKVTTGKNGKFKFDFDMGHQYRLSFSAPGCVDMFMLLDLRVPPEKMNLFPDYAIEVPFFEPSNTTVKVDKYKDQPFAKVIYDGKAGFWDDPNYKFTEEILIDHAEESRKLAAAAAAAEKKAREEADRQARELAAAEDERKAKAMAEQKILEEAVSKAKDEDSRRKAEEALKAKQQETMESEAMRLEREKQDKVVLEKKNRGIKSQYENDLLKMVAESEKQANLQKYNSMEKESQANSVIQTMRRDAELKAASEMIRQQEREREERTLVNKQTKVVLVKRLVEAAALTEKTIRVSQCPPKDPQSYTHISAPNVVVSVTEGVMSDIQLTIITRDDSKTVFKKETYFWGSCYYYKDNKATDEKTYTAEMVKYSAK